MDKKQLLKALTELGALDKDSLGSLTKDDLQDLAIKLRALTKKSFKDYSPQPKQHLFHTSPAQTRMILGGNRSGKTMSSFHDVIWQLTGEYPEWYPDNLKLIPPVYTRWIATDFKHGVGGVFQVYFDELVPKGYIARIVKTQQGVLNKVFFKNGSILELMTNEQDIDEFEGWRGHRLHIDEPCTRSRYIASKRGLIDYGGRVSFSLTPLSEPWIYDELYDKADGKRIFAVNVSMRDNKYLPKEEIEEFEKSLTDDEKEARLYGRFMHLTGVVYKEFNREVHVVPDREIPRNWRIVHVLDPHDRKPHANLWAAVDPFNNYYIIDELEVGGTVPELAKTIRAKEGNRPTHLRIMDPNKSKAPAAVGAKGSLKSEFAKERLYFFTNVNDRLDAGHLAVKKRLIYDKNKKIGVGNRPTLYFFKSCSKAISSMARYIWDDYRDRDSRSLKEKPKDLHKDFPDLIRYLCMANPTHSMPDIEIRSKPKRSTTGW